MKTFFAFGLGILFVASSTFAGDCITGHIEKTSSEKCPTRTQMAVVALDGQSFCILTRWYSQVKSFDRYVGQGYFTVWGDVDLSKKQINAWNVLRGSNTNRAIELGCSKEDGIGDGGGGGP